MNEKVEKVFEMLEVEPYEEFHLVLYVGGTPHDTEFLYRVNNRLKLECYCENSQVWELSTYSIADILEEKLEIVKPIKISDEMRKVFKVLYHFGYRYLGLEDNQRNVYYFALQPVYDSVCGRWQKQIGDNKLSLCTIAFHLNCLEECKSFISQFKTNTLLDIKTLIAM